MRTWRSTALVMGAALIALVPFAPAQAARPRIYHTISATHAAAAFSETAPRFTLDVVWTASGPLEHSTVHNHVRFPHAGIVHANDNNLLRPATATVSVSGSAASASGVTEDASLERVKSICMEIVWPHYDGDSNWCFGFPA